MRIGIDFDNTIARYDGLFQALARERGLGSDSVALGSKQALRDHLRRLPGGEEVWRDLQAEAYGPRMAEAEVYSGLQDFLRRCKADGIAVFVVSHKTRFAANDKRRVDLRAAALAWLDANGFFGPENCGLDPENIFFEDTRRTKVARIAALDCSHFIDDLEEVFAEPGFPDEVAGVLLGAATGERFHTCRDWREITDYVFGA